MAIINNVCFNLILTRDNVKPVCNNLEMEKPEVSPLTASLLRNLEMCSCDLRMICFQDLSHITVALVLEHKSQPQRACVVSQLIMIHKAKYIKLQHNMFHYGINDNCVTHHLLVILPFTTISYSIRGTDCFAYLSYC